MRWRAGDTVFSPRQLQKGVDELIRYAYERLKEIPEVILFDPSYRRPSSRFRKRSLLYCHKKMTSLL